MEFIYQFIPRLETYGAELMTSFFQTIQMLAVAGGFSFIIGIFVGIILVTSKPQGLLENKFCYYLLSKMIDALRSIPFLILLILTIPLSRMIVGTGIGVKGSYLGLILGTVPFFARQIEVVLSEVDKGLIEASKSMGFGPIEIIYEVYLKESIPGITRVTTITFVSLLSVSAMAGAIGAGGLGDFAIRYGHSAGYTEMIWIVVVIILMMISLFQAIGNYIIKKTTHE